MRRVHEDSGRTGVHVDEDAGQELERVDEGVIVLNSLPALGLIEQEL
jgi:hypothetical protein